MYKKITFIMMLLVLITLVSSAPPLFEVDTESGYSIEPTFVEAIRTGEDFEFEVHVINVSNGVPITTGIGCYLHLYYQGGGHLFEGYDDTVSHDFDYAFDVGGGNFTGRGEYLAKVQCNDSTHGGAVEERFIVNDYGELLTDATARNFNNSMIFLMIIFVLMVVGIFKIDHYIARFALYLFAHLLFIVGTFSVWQFTQGYAISYVGLAGVWKVLFYVSISALFPIVILGMAWIIYIHTVTDEMKGMMDRGMSPDEAFNRSAKNWMGGSK